MGLAVLASGWWYTYNQIVYQQAILDGWNKPGRTANIRYGIERVDASEKVAVLDRRTLGFFLGFDPEIWKFPYGPVAQNPPRFWSLLIATTFVDYHNYTFVPKNGRNPMVPAGGSIMDVTFIPLSRASVIGGTYIAVLTLIGWLGCVVILLKHRATARLAALGVPLAAMAGQASFVVQFPFEFEGVVKGLYFHFASLPLYAVFGIAVAWLWSKPLLRPFAVLGFVAVAAVASYTLVCRFLS
jgi:hypothetical protein